MNNYINRNKNNTYPPTIAIVAQACFEAFALPPKCTNNMDSNDAAVWASAHGRANQRLSAIAHLMHMTCGESSQKKSSHLAEELLCALAAEEMSASSVQRFANACVKDGINDSEMMKLACIGRNGRHPQNAFRDICRYYKFDVKELAPWTQISVKMRDTVNAGKIIDVKSEIMCPHDVFHHCAIHDKDRFAKILGTPKSISQWWEGQSLDDPKLYKHPLLDNVEYVSKCIPIKLHSHAVVVTKTIPCM